MPIRRISFTALFLCIAYMQEAYDTKRYTSIDDFTCIHMQQTENTNH